MNSVMSLSNAQEKTSAAPALRPAGWLDSLLLFGIPAAGTFFAFHVFRPWLETQGYPELISYLASLTVPLALIFTAALVAYHKVEGRPLTWAAFAQRMRFPRLRVRDVLIGIGLFVIGSVGLFAFTQVEVALIRSGSLPVPAKFPLFANPLVTLTAPMVAQAAGGQIHGQWQIVLLYAVMFFFNMTGEELWWRGYILPRQELAFGRWTWLVHGTLWACFHAFMWWNIIGLLPVCWVLSFSAQKMKTNWPALIMHILTNIGGLLIVIAAVVG
jgi:membrane protease YdiL (CAAX protease family)